MIKPLFDQVLVERIETKSESNLTIPESAQHHGDVIYANVVAIGDGDPSLAAKFSPRLAELDAFMRTLQQVRVGDTVIVPSNAGYLVEHEKRKYRMVLEREVLGIVMSPKTT